MEITFIFRNIEGYTSSGLGPRSFPVDRLAGRQAGRQKSLVFEIFQLAKLATLLL